MHYRKSIVAISCLLMTLPVGNALACGESLFRVGKGVAFREYTAPLPGTILAVARTEAELLMIEQLAAAGHDVHVVADPSLVSSELTRHEHTFDIVLAYYDQRAEIAAQTATASVTFLPVTMEGTAQASQAAAEFEHTLSNDDSVKQFLRVIHKTLKARS
jgi:uncharacterized protein (DUF58 family)